MRFIALLLIADNSVKRTIKKIIFQLNLLLSLLYTIAMTIYPRYRVGQKSIHNKTTVQTIIGDNLK